MSLNIGIVGLPNVGKSTTFNALTEAQNATVASYPFCTIEPNLAVVPVPDPRVDSLARLAARERVIHATIEFVDIAGLVRGASQGEGLGNQFLGQIRNVDAILHVVRCFEDENVAHVSGRLEPAADIRVIKDELTLADLEQLERKIQRLESDVTGNRGLQRILTLAQSLYAHLEDGQPMASFPEREDPQFTELDREMQFLSNKPVIYLANVGEDALAGPDECTETIRRVAEQEGAEVVKLCAELEVEFIDLTSEERKEMLELAGIEEAGLAQVIRRCYRILGLISFFTMNEEEVRAWTIPAGTKAPQAAGRVHSDFERGFTGAEVIPYERFETHGSRTAAKAAGEVRIEGKEYLVQDGDLILFRFNL